MPAAILVCLVVLVHGGDVGSDALGIEDDTSVSLLQMRAEVMQDDEVNIDLNTSRAPCLVSVGHDPESGRDLGCPEGMAHDPYVRNCCTECPSKKVVRQFRRRYARSQNKCPTGMTVPGGAEDMASSCCVECATATCADIKEKTECTRDGGCSNLKCKWTGPAYNNHWHGEVKGSCQDKRKKKCKAYCDKNKQPWEKKCKQRKCAGCPQCGGQAAPESNEEGGQGALQANSTCTPKAELQPEHEAGTCVGRCWKGYECCRLTNRCGPVGSPCDNPPATCIGTCAGSTCCPAQGNQCIKGPVSNFDDLCKCAEV